MKQSYRYERQGGPESAVEHDLILKVAVAHALAWCERRGFEGADVIRTSDGVCVAEISGNLARIHEEICLACSGTGVAPEAFLRRKDRQPGKFCRVCDGHGRKEPE